MTIDSLLGTLLFGLCIVQYIIALFFLIWGVRTIVAGRKNALELDTDQRARSLLKSRLTGLKYCFWGCIPGLPATAELIFQGTDRQAAIVRLFLILLVFPFMALIFIFDRKIRSIQ